VPTVLIAEPNPSLRQLECQALSRDYRVVRTSGAEEAIRTAARHEIELDLLLTEICLPNLNGWDLTELLRLDYPNFKVIYLASSINPEMKAHTRSATVVLMDERRFNPTRLRRAVQATLGVQMPAFGFKRLFHMLGALGLGFVERRCRFVRPK
jgi:two-component system, cell cycle sensor histidine kinase and response regulator CckA